MLKLFSCLALAALNVPGLETARATFGSVPQGAFTAQDLIGGWRGPAQELPVDGMTMLFSESLTYYDAGGGMRAELIVAMSGQVDGFDLASIDNRMSVRIEGSWAFEGQAITTTTRNVIVTPLGDQDGLGEAADMIRAMYLTIPVLTFTVEGWNGATLKIREPMTGETLDMHRAR